MLHPSAASRSPAAIPPEEQPDLPNVGDLSAAPFPSEESTVPRFRFLPHRPRQWILLTIVLVVLAIPGYVIFNFARAALYFRAAEKARDKRDFVTSRRYLEANLKKWPNSARDHFLLARVARQMRLSALAQEHLNDCQQLEGPTDDIALERTLLQVQQGALTQGVESLLRRRLKEGAAESDDIFEALSVGCLASYRFTTALAYLNDWLERKPDNAAALAWRSVAHEHIQDFAAARDDCRRTLALEPGNLEAEIRLGEMLLMTTQIQEALELLEPLYERHPNNPLVGMRLAQAEIKSNRADQAETILDRMVSRFPSDAPVLLERGRLAMARGQPAAAEGWLRRAASLVPWDYQVNYSLLLSLRQQGKEQAAKEVNVLVRRLEADYARLHELGGRLRGHPYDLSVRCDIGRIHLESKNDKEGIAWLKSAVKIDAQYPLANRLLAEYYEGMGEPALARPYREALAGGGSPRATGE
jgi:predicted Zn-dependent protease